MAQYEMLIRLTSISIHLMLYPSESIQHQRDIRYVAAVSLAQLPVRVLTPFSATCGIQVEQKNNGTESMTLTKQYSFK